ncbi:hypothetical protein [Streptomyces sp. MST-110588]|uniref:hypothetical protein n=1 Tax=Streptomyces sp. MST-110588 TaxID=2833628 RepID=UPI001F5CCB01|nr:hypothetical protein [Streptomyces sp. MST-110588]UNO43531.1 hypothetical protein KGS77_33725 [Streptomyces sp. MST-110588]
MVRKKVEGDEEQRRAAAREAERAHETPGARHVTTGGSKQRTHLTSKHSLTHEEKIATVHEGKQQSVPASATRRERDPAARDAERTFRGRGSPEYSARHEAVFRAVADMERQHEPGRGAYLDEVARSADLPKEETRALLHDLTATHKLVTVLRDSGDTPDQGPRFEVKPGS